MNCFSLQHTALHWEYTEMEMLFDAAPVSTKKLFNKCVQEEPLSLRGAFCSASKIYLESKYQNAYS